MGTLKFYLGVFVYAYHTKQVPPEQVAVLVVQGSMRQLTSPPVQVLGAASQLQPPQ